MCEAGKVGIWLTPEEANTIHSALEILSSRIQVAAVTYMENIIAELDKTISIQAQEDPENLPTGEPEPDEDEEDEEEIRRRRRRTPDEDDPDPDDTREIRAPGERESAVTV